MVKDHHTIYYCTKTQVRGLCVGEDITLLHEMNQKQNDHISAYTKPTHLIFGTVIDIVNIFYHTKNQVGGLCVGGNQNESLLKN